MDRLEGKQVRAAWYNPRNGAETRIGDYPNSGVREFDPPGEPANGNDWVLILDSKDKP